jgi:acetoacetyl-CoA reductase
MIVTIISGASRGIGKNISETLLKNNHKVYNLSRTESTIKSEYLINIICDVTNNNIYNIISEIIEKEKIINNFIHCAGIIQDSFFHKMTYQQWINVHNTNFLSLYNLLNPIINNMRNNNFGNVILISSVNAKKGALGQTNYASSKSAMFGFTKSLALENASKNIMINCICPGFINTSMTKEINENILNKIIDNIPLKKLGTTEDITNLVVFLIEKNNYITGSILDINGGLI